jgi:phenylpropionate dioxygenase-like ring-hydroxylating dioxygenase large terminal subunit
MALSSKFLRNCWYVAAIADELDGTVRLARTILGEPVLLMQDAAGIWQAIRDRCPHRFAPLSAGHCSSGQVTCAYHGLTFDAFGGCVHNPHGPVTSALAVPSYPVRQSGPLFWIWMGDPALANVTPVPSYPWTSDDSHFVGMGHIHGLAHYELMTDNIMDLSHIEFLHPVLGSDAVSKAKVEVESRDETVIAVRHMRNEHLSDPLARTYQTGGAPVDRELRVEWRAPALMELTVIIQPLAPADAPPRGSRTLHLFTPETASSTHYFYVSGMDRKTIPPEIATGFRDTLERVFLCEDKPMIDAQQVRIGKDNDIMDLGPAMLAIDKAPVLARRRLRRLIEQETQAGT